MLKAIAFGLAVGAAVQAWRNYPADSGPANAHTLALVFIIGVVCAYLGGRWHGRHNGGATAVAVATATATAVADARQSVQLVVMTGQGAGGAGVHAMQVPDESVSWFDGQRRQVEASELEGMDLEELGVVELEPEDAP